MTTYDTGWTAATAKLSYRFTTDNSALQFRGGAQADGTAGTAIFTGLPTNAAAPRDIIHTYNIGGSLTVNIASVTAAGAVIEQTATPVNTDFFFMDEVILFNES